MKRTKTIKPPFDTDYKIEIGFNEDNISEIKRYLNIDNLFIIDFEGVTPQQTIGDDNIYLENNLSNLASIPISFSYCSIQNGNVEVDHINFLKDAHELHISDLHNLIYEKIMHIYQSGQTVMVWGSDLELEIFNNITRYVDDISFDFVNNFLGALDLSKLFRLSRNLAKENLQPLFWITLIKGEEIMKNIGVQTFVDQVLRGEIEKFDNEEQIAKFSKQEKRKKLFYRLDGNFNNYGTISGKLSEELEEYNNSDVESQYFILESVKKFINTSSS